MSVEQLSRHNRARRNLARCRGQSCSSLDHVSVVDRRTALRGYKCLTYNDCALLRSGSRGLSALELAGVAETIAGKGIHAFDRREGSFAAMPCSLNNVTRV